MLEIKRLNGIELENKYNEIVGMVEKQIEKEYNARLEMMKTFEKAIKKAKEDSGNEYIASDLTLTKFGDVKYTKQWANDRKDDLLKYKLEIFYSVHDIYNTSYENIFHKYNYLMDEFEIKKNKIKFNGSVLDRFGDVTPYNIYKFFKFLSLSSNFDVPQWDYNSYGNIRNTNKIYQLGNIEFKILKNGKVEIYNK